MAERSNATSKKNQEAAQDVSTLQKRGRRRLVGAIALVLLAVIVLPMVFDPEPKPAAPPVSIRIPSEEGSAFTPKAGSKPTPAPAPVPQTGVVTPSQPTAQPTIPAVPKKQDKVPPPYAKVETQAAEPVRPVETPAPPPVEKPVAKAPEARSVEKAAPPAKPPEKKTAAAPAPPAGERLVVQVGAFGSPDKVREVTDQLKEARLAHFTESIATAKGAVTRVRLGPFSSREAAEKARDRAKALGLNPANPVNAPAPAAKSAAK